MKPYLRKLQYSDRPGVYTLTIPKSLVEEHGWKAGDHIVIAPMQKKGLYKISKLEI